MPFLFYHITCFHAFFFFGDFCTFQNLAFLIFLGFLIKTKSWVFVHASYKHDSHALIEKFEIRVLMFLRDFGILWNWAKLDKIDLCEIELNWTKLTCVINRLSDYNMFCACYVVQLIKIKLFSKIRFSKLVIFYNS